MTAHHTPPLDPIMAQILDGAPTRMDPHEDIHVTRTRLRDLATSTRGLFPDLATVDLTIAGRGGHQIPLRVYWPPAHTDSTRSLPVVLYCHGGGFALGDLDTYDPICIYHAIGSGAIVVSVDYRLAPEHPYPAAVDDAWAALKWVAAHAAELRGDALRLAVAGDSAGGNLAAVIAQLARHGDGPHVVFQLLWYPTTTWDFSLPSFVENEDAPILDMPALQTFIRWYAGGVDLTRPPATLAPARARSLAGLPPTYIGIAGYDPLRDDGARYAEVLTAAGVMVQLHNAETLTHGYAYFTGVVPAATQAMDLGIGALRSALHHGPCKSPRP
jgi:acetyl esterase/lipase